MSGPHKPVTRSAARYETSEECPPLADQVTGAAFTGGPAGDNLGEEGTAMKTYKSLDASVQPTTSGAEQTTKPPVSSVSSVPGDVGTSQRLTSFLHLNISSADSQSHPPSSAPSIVASGAGAQQLAGLPVPAPRRDAQVLIGKEAPAPTSNLSVGLQPGAEPAVLTTTYSTGSSVRPESGVPVAALNAGTQWQRQSAVQVLPATGAGPQLQQDSAVHVPAAYAGPRLHQMPATMSPATHVGPPLQRDLAAPAPTNSAGPQHHQMSTVQDPVVATTLRQQQLPRPHTSSMDLQPQHLRNQPTISSIFPQRGGYDLSLSGVPVYGSYPISEPSHRGPGPAGATTSRLGLHPGLEVGTAPAHGVGIPSSSSPRVQLPIFKGTSEWKVFWLQFRRTARQYSWSAETTLDHLVASLRDDALQLYAELPEPTQADLSLTIDALARRFNDHGLPETYRASLMTLRKQPKETLEEYASRVHRTVTKAYPGIAGSKLADDLTIENLVGGLLDSNLVYDVLTKKPRTVQEAIDLIQWHESCKGTQRKKIGLKQVSVEEPGLGTKKPQPNVRRVDGKRFVTEEQLVQFGKDLKDDLVKEVKQACQGIRQPRRNQGPRANTECFYCHELGHFARDCPQRAKNGDSLQEKTDPETHSAAPEPSLGLN